MYLLNFLGVTVKMEQMDICTKTIPFPGSLLVKSGVHYHILDSLPIALTPSSTIGNTLYFPRCEKVPQASSLFLRGSPKKKTVISLEAPATF